jgi:hypothetical protein
MKTTTAIRNKVMSDKQREAFEKWHYATFEEDLVWNEKRNLYEDFFHHQAWKGWQAAAAYYAPKLTEETEKARFWYHEYTHLARAGVERLAEYGHIVDPAEKLIEAAKYREGKTLRSAGVQFKEEA